MCDEERQTQRVVVNVRLQWFRKDGVVGSGGIKQKKCQGKVISSNLCFIHRSRSREEGGQSETAITGSSCVQSGLWGEAPGGSLLAPPGTGPPPIWPAAQRPGHLGAQSVVSD